MPVPAHEDWSPACLRRRVGGSGSGIVEVHRPLIGQPLASANHHRVPIDDTTDAKPLVVHESLNVRQRDRVRIRVRTGGSSDRRGNRMFGRKLQCPCQPKQFGRINTRCGHRINDTHLALGDGPRLVQDDRVDLASGLKDLRTADQDSQLSATTCSHKQSGRSRQAQRTRAGDDQHGNGGREGGFSRVTCREPTDQHNNGEHQDDRHEDPRHTIRQALDVRLAVLRVLDQPSHLRKLGVSTNSGCLDDQPPGGVNRGADDFGCWTNINRHWFASKHRCIHSRISVNHNTIGRDLLARPSHELLADEQRRDRHALFEWPIRPVAKNCDVLRTH